MEEIEKLSVEELLDKLETKYIPLETDGILLTKTDKIDVGHDWLSPFSKRIQERFPNLRLFVCALDNDSDMVYLPVSKCERHLLGDHVAEQAREFMGKEKGV